MPQEDTVKRNPHPPTLRHTARRVPEVYCRRDNRVYAVCPHAAAGSQCHCLYEVETADALFEETQATEEESGH